MITYEAQQLSAAVARIEARLDLMQLDGWMQGDKLDTVANNTAPVIGWGWALLTGIGINVIGLPLIEHANIPYLSPAVQQLVDIEQQLAQEIGIGYATAKDVVAGEGKGVHPQLMAVYRRAAELAAQQGYSIAIIDGLRTAVEQAENVRSGASKTMNSRHLMAKNGWGHALDLTVDYGPQKTNAQDWVWARKINALMQQASTETGIPVEWGGSWKSFPDGFHWQLPWTQYPSDRPFNALKTDQLPVLTERNYASLITEIKRSESSGGKYGIESPDCYLGAFQTGAATLAEVGLINRQKFDAQSTETKAGRGSHCAFLADSNNWTLNGGKAAYLASKAIQDDTARKMINLHIRYGVNGGALDKDSSQAVISGYVKAAQFGHKRATAWYAHGIDSSDGNGKRTSAYAAEGEAVIQPVTHHTNNLIQRLAGALQQWI